MSQLIKAPATAGAVSTVIVIKNTQPIQFDFNAEEAAFNRVGNDLDVRFENGSQVILTDFFVTEGEDLSPFILLDGTEVSGEDFLQSMNPDMDIQTAAGPAASANGSGSGEYADGAGDLLDGVDGLSSLGAFQWDAANRALRLPLETIGTVMVPEDEAIGAMPETEKPIGNYSARAVLYKTSASASNTVLFRVNDADGNPITNPADFQFSFDSDSYADFFTPPTAEGGGIFGLTLTKEGFVALQGANGPNLYAYFTITVGDAEPYRMQVVVNKDGSFSSAKEDDISNNGAHLESFEWHTEAQGTGDGIRDGAFIADNESWFGSSSTPIGFSGGFLSGRGNDSINIAGKTTSLKGSTINAGPGDDTVSLTGGLYGIHANEELHNTITGANEVAIESKTITQRGGTGTSGVGIYASNGGINLISNKGLDEQLNLIISGKTEGTQIVPTAIKATSGGKNTILGGEQNDTITLSGSVAAIGGTNTFDGGKGYDTLHIEGLSADPHGLNAIKGFEKITIHNQGENETYWNGHQATISANKGNNTIDGAQDVTVTATSDSAHQRILGVYTRWGDAQSTNTITANTVDINVTGKAVSYGVDGNNEFNVEDAFNLNVTGKYAAGLHLETATTKVAPVQTINASEEAKVNIKAAGDPTAMGMSISLGGFNTINANDVMIDVFAEGLTQDSISPGAYGMHVNRVQRTLGVARRTVGAGNYITASNEDAPLTVKIYVAAGEGQKALAMYAEGNHTSGSEIFGENKITGSNTGDNIYLKGNILAHGAGRNIIETGAGNDRIHIEGLLESAGGLNKIAAGDGDNQITITGDIIATERNSVMALHNNDIATGTGNDVISIGGSLTAGSVNASTNNRINTDLGNDIVKIGGDLNANQSNHTNTIDLGAGNDILIVNGGMFGDGINNIISAEGNDIIFISGDVSGRSSITTGSGNDYVHLVGNVNGLTLNMGDGYDTLVLTADGFSDFAEKYGPWLSGDGFKGDHVKGIHVNIGNLGDDDTVESFINELNNFNPLKGKDISYSFIPDSGEQTLMLDNLKEIDLGGVLGIDPAAETSLENLLINLQGKTSNKLTIDSDDLRSRSDLQITGDADDTIILKGDWHASSSNGDFTTYSMGEDNFVEIHNDLLAKLIILSSS